ncbi:MAG: molybdate ABC transporter substrate-binding protein [Myxococcaceae bacterium]
MQRQPRPWRGRSVSWLVLLGTQLAASVGQAAGAAAPEPPRELLVFAAASLREACTALQPAFEQSHPGLHLRFNFAGSQELRTQLEQGARADVFLSADRRQMELARQAGVVGPEQPLVSNIPVLVVPRANPAGLMRFADLPTVKRLVVGAPEVPIGHYTLELLERANQVLGADFSARVEARVVSRELNVKQVLTKVLLGEADAGIVYQSDAVSALARVQVVPIPVDINVVAHYPMAVVQRSSQPALATAYLQFLVSPTSQAVFAASGFGPP